ncbi:MAG: hypothetical protein RLZ12_529 [Bacillota bacterium]|jgi:hypothetical protein
MTLSLKKINLAWDMPPWVACGDLYFTHLNLSKLFSLLVLVFIGQLIYETTLYVAQTILSENGQLWYDILIK